MLAAVTRYVVGLVYISESGFDAERELEEVKNREQKDNQGNLPGKYGKIGVG